MSTIFIDRDGVINENRVDHVKRWEEFRFIAGACEAIARLTRAGHRIIICTNQAIIARGVVSVEMVEDIHQRMTTQIEALGGHIEKVYYCPHSKEGSCPCRKPRPGMLLQARDDLGLDLNDAIFIGDSISDIRAGYAAGVSSLLVLTGLGQEQLRDHFHEAPGPFRVARDLSDATDFILTGHYSINTRTRGA